MTTLISALSLQLETGHGPLFQDLSFTVKLGDRIGLIGHNGCGKSSLLDVLAGSREPGVGSVQYAAMCRLQHVEQHLPPRLADLTTREALLESVGEQRTEHWRVDSLLDDLELATAADIPVSDLSGGQHTRLLLGRAVLAQPNLLLLDEPSNHLDLPSLLWLENFLRRWQGGFILVSHDARLLDSLSDRSWILRDQRLYSFDMPCSRALVALAEADATAQARHAGEQSEIDRLAASSKRLAIWGARARQRETVAPSQVHAKACRKTKGRPDLCESRQPVALEATREAIGGGPSDGLRRAAGTRPGGRTDPV